MPIERLIGVVRAALNRIAVLLLLSSCFCGEHIAARAQTATAPQSSHEENALWREVWIVGGTNTHAVVVSKAHESDASIYQEVISALCGSQDNCSLSFWSDSALVPKSLPMTPEQADGKTANFERKSRPYRNGPVHSDNFRWACHINENSGDCFPRPGESLPPPPKQTKASFDCGKATTPIEVVICSNETLSQLDGELGAAYEKKRTELNESDRQILLEIQRDWLRKRRDYCPSLPAKIASANRDFSAPASCLVELYVEWLPELRDFPGLPHDPRRIELLYSENDELCHALQRIYGELSHYPAGAPKAQPAKFGREWEDIYSEKFSAAGLVGPEALHKSFLGKFGTTDVHYKTLLAKDRKERFVYVDDRQYGRASISTRIWIFKPGVDVETEQYDGTSYINGHPYPDKDQRIVPANVDLIVAFDSWSAASNVYKHLPHSLRLRY